MYVHMHIYIYFMNIYLFIEHDAAMVTIGSTQPKIAPNINNLAIRISAGKVAICALYTCIYIHIHAIRTFLYLAIFFWKAYVYACIRTYPYVSVRI